MSEYMSAFAWTLHLREECDMSSIFKWSTADLNSELSFSWAGYLTKIKQPILLYYLPVAKGKRWIHAFMRHLVQDLNLGYPFHFLVVKTYANHDYGANV